MIRLRADQLAALASGLEVSFIRRLTDLLRDNFPESRDLPEAGLRKDIAKQLIKARSYGLETQQHAATYVVCAWVLGADFDSEFPAARDTLTAADLSASQKAEWLADWTQELFHVLEARSGSR